MNFNIFIKKLWLILFILTIFLYIILKKNLVILIKYIKLIFIYLI